MVQINFAQKTVSVKIVYYGPGMSGKTTNLEIVHQRAPDSNRGDLTSIATDGDRTLFFDFMPLDLGTVAGMRTQFQIYTVPGQVYYNSTRKLVLQGVDGVIFIADSSASMLQENLESLANLKENLEEYGKDIATVPYVIQYNKRDLPDAMPIEELEKALNPAGVPSFEGVASTGQGVFPTLKALASLVLETIHSQQGATSGASASTGMPAPPAAAPTVDDGPPPSLSPPVQSAGTGFYPAPSQVAQQPPAAPAAPPVAPQVAAERAQPAPAQPASAQPASAQPASAGSPSDLRLGSAMPASEPVASTMAVQPPIPSNAPQEASPGIPSAFPQPASASPPAVDPMSKTQVHAPPQVAPQKQVPQQQVPQEQEAVQQPMSHHALAPGQQPEGTTPGQGSPESHLRIASQFRMPGQKPAVGAEPHPAKAHPSPSQLMQVGSGTRMTPPPSSSRVYPVSSAQHTTRIKPRSSVRATPRPQATKNAALVTGIFVTLALVTGIVLGSLVFNLF